jgi:hypothetical protein
MTNLNIFCYLLVLKTTTPLLEDKKSYIIVPPCNILYIYNRYAHTYTVPYRYTFTPNIVVSECHSEN